MVHFQIGDRVATRSLGPVYSQSMKSSMCALIVTAFSPLALALELVLPEYRNAVKDREVLLEWQAQLIQAGVPVVQLTRLPLSDIDNYLAQLDHGQVLIEVPPQHYQQGVKNGWRPITRIGKRSRMAQWVLPGLDRTPKTVGTPPVTTAAYVVAQQLSPVKKTIYPSHGDCLRSMASAQVESCVTAVSFGRAYAQRFGLDLQIFGDSVPIAPSVMLASPNVPDRILGQVQATPIRFESLNATYIPFDAQRDEPLMPAQ